MQICKTKKIDVEKLENTIIREKYSEKTTENYLGKQNFENPQEQWDHIIRSCLTAGEVLGVRLKEKRHDDVILEDLSNEQKQLKNQIDACQEKGKREELRKIGAKS